MEIHNEMDILELTKKYETEIRQNYNNGLNKSSIDKYQKGSIRTCEAYALYSLIRENNFQNILDIGTGKGFSSLIFAKALQKNNLAPAQIDTIDINKNYEIELFKKFELDFLITFHKGKSSQILPMLNKNYDMALIDGEHTYQQTKEDFINIYPKVKVGGVIAFHDVYLRNIPKSGPCDVLKEIVEQGGRVIWFDEGIFNYFAFQEDTYDAERILKKWEQHNYSYVRRDWSPKCLMALYIKTDENIVLTMDKVVVPDKIIQPDEEYMKDWLND